MRIIIDLTGAEPIERSIEIKITNKKKEEEKKVEKQNCVICMEQIETGEEKFTPCMHGPFHLQCIERWKAVKPQCPLCKAYIGDNHAPRSRIRIIPLENALEWSPTRFIPME